MQTTMMKTATLAAGDKAPDFTLPDQNGDTIALSSFRGRKHVVLVFHPLAFTSICSVQMPGYSKEKQTFEGMSAQVLGVSVDSVPTLKAWADSLGGIDYPMLADFHPHGEVAKKFGILRPEGYSERATIVIDMAGVVRYIDVHEIGKVPDNAKLVDFLRSMR